MSTHPSSLRAMVNSNPDLTPRQRQLVEGALRLLDRVGIEGFTMRSLAEEVGVSPMAAYKHFSRQRDLQIELWRACMRDLNDYVVGRCVPFESDPAAAFMEVCRSMIEFSLDQPYRFEFLFNHPFVREVRKDESTHGDRFYLWVVAKDYVTRAQDRGLFRSDVDAESLLLSALATLHGLCYIMVSERLEQLTSVGRAEAVQRGLFFIREGLIAR